MASGIVEGGSEGGLRGGEVVAEGTPGAVGEAGRSFAEAYLKPMLKGQQEAAE